MKKKEKPKRKGKCLTVWLPDQFVDEFQAFREEEREVARMAGDIRPVTMRNLVHEAIVDLMAKRRRGRKK